MKPNLDPAQYGNQPDISIQHYLINMIHRILTAVDKSTKSETFAVIASLIDWDNAFPRQCPKLGIESFMRNGVRSALIPVLINYFQDRKMSVKWHGCRSLPRTLKGGGPQGATLGLLTHPLNFFFIFDRTRLRFFYQSFGMDLTSQTQKKVKRSYDSFLRKNNFLFCPSTMSASTL